MTNCFGDMFSRGIFEVSRPASGDGNRSPIITRSKSGDSFPPLGYRPTPVNTLLANALDLTAPASEALLRNRKNAWVQLAGHSGSFSPAGPYTIWKKVGTDGEGGGGGREESEAKCYHALMEDSVRVVVPKFYRQIEYNSTTFIEIEDLLQRFHDPNIMDIKMGTRTFLESEVTNQKLRPDLYKKMIAVDPAEPTQEEHEQGAVTKLRYMQFRERGSSSAMYGFRVDAIRLSGETPCTDLKKVRTKEEVKATITLFLAGRRVVYHRLLVQLQNIRRRFEDSRYFRHHEIIGSSLLILYDRDDNANIWMIDFAKTVHVEHRMLTHRGPWSLGNHEDGFLTGLDNLILIMTELCQQLNIPETPKVGGRRRSPLIPHLS